MNWKALAITLSSVAAGAGIALAYNHGRGRGGMLGRVDIVDGKRHDGDTNALIRRGYREVPCTSGLKNQARCWSKGKGLMGGYFKTDRERSEEYLTDGRFKRIKAGRTRQGTAYEIYGGPNGIYSVRDADTLKEIGTAYLATDWGADGANNGPADYLSVVRIDPAFKRQGIATTLYSAIERDTGRKLRPSPVAQSEDAKAFWAKRGLGRSRGKGLKGAADDDDEDDAPDFGEDSWFDRLRAKLGAKRQGIRDAFKASPAIIVTQTDGRETLVIKTGEMQNPEDGPERVTFFWKDGPVGHATRKTTEELIEEVSGYGSTARPATDAEVMAWTSTDEFAEGAARVAAVQRANAGLKGGKRPTKRKLWAGEPSLDLDAVETRTVETFRLPFPYERKPQIPGRLHKEATIERVAIAPLIATQKAVTQHGVAKYADGAPQDDPPIVYRAADGRMWIADGHHRIAAAWQRGDDTVRAKVVQVPAGFASAALGGIKNRDEINSHTMRAIGPELDDAERRAYAAGATGDLEYIGAGMTGIVFCDERNKAFKVARNGDTAVAIEARWIAAANKIIPEHVPKLFGFDRDQNVLVRECMRPVPRERSRWNERKLFALHERIGKTMHQYGWGRPEYKPDSYVYTQRGPVLVDAGFAVRRGRELVRETLDYLNGRRKLQPQERPTDIAWEIRMERGETIPPAVANKLLARLKAIDPNVET